MMKRRNFLRFSFKKFVAVGLFCVMFLQCSNLSFAADNQSNVKQLCFKGVNYTITESTDSNGNKNVLVSGGGEKASVVNDGNTLKLTSVKNGVSKCMSIPIVKSYNKKVAQANGLENYNTRLWGYGYTYNTDLHPNFGMNWGLSSGDHGTWCGFDNNNSSTRDYAYEFCSKVRNLSAKQKEAVGMSYGLGTAIAAALAEIGFSGGTAAIVACLSAFGVGEAAYHEWLAACDLAGDCDISFDRVKQSL